jgi:hypothetical protein
VEDRHLELRVPKALQNLNIVLQQTIVVQITQIIQTIQVVRTVQEILHTDNHRIHKAHKALRIEILNLNIKIKGVHLLTLLEQIILNQQAHVLVAVAAVLLNHLVLQVQNQVAHLHHIADVNQHIKNIQL